MSRPPGDKASEAPWRATLFLLGGFAAVVGLLVGAGAGVWFTAPWIAGPALQSAAQFGDMFGAANALFSALAFAGMLLALHLQRAELAAQREELRLTREELARQSDAQQEHAETAIRAAKINGYGALLQSASSRAASVGHFDMVETLVRHPLDKRVRSLESELLGLINADPEPRRSQTASDEA